MTALRDAFCWLALLLIVAICNALRLSMHDA